MISSDIVDVLRHEHEQIRRLCAEVQGAERDRKRRPLAALQQALCVHELGERAVAHPAARNSSAAGDTIGLACQAEGEYLERSLTELSRLGVRHPGFDDTFAAFSDAVLDHAAHEERDEFPLLRRQVSVQRLHMMASAMHDIRIMGIS